MNTLQRAKDASSEVSRLAVIIVERLLTDRNHPDIDRMLESYKKLRGVQYEKLSEFIREVEEK